MNANVKAETAALAEALAVACNAAADLSPAVFNAFLKGVQSGIEVARMGSEKEAS